MGAAGAVPKAEAQPVSALGVPSGAHAIAHGGPRARLGRAARHRALVLLAFNLPSGVLMIAMVLAPVAYLFVLSLNSVKAGYDMTLRFVGLGNYIGLLQNSDVWAALHQTVIFTVLSVVLAEAIGVGIGLLMGREFRTRPLFLALLIIPWATPFVVNALMWKWIFDPVYGALDGLLVQLGVSHQYVAWLSTPTSAMNVVSFANAWKLVPFVAIIVLAQIQAIPGELWQAAEIDGASGFAILRFITMPLIRPALVTSVVFVTIWSLRTFDIIYVMTNGGPGGATSILNWLTYAWTFQDGDFGRGSALGFMLGLVTLVWTLIYVAALRFETDQ